MSILDKIEKNKDLKEMSSFQIGGKAELFLEISKKEDLPLVYDWVKENKISLHLLGGGTNLLINSKGVKGLVLKLKNNKIENHGLRLTCEAGAFLGRTLNVARNEKLSGLEWAIGIPGTIGGAVCGNAGAYGSAMSDIVESVDFYDSEQRDFFHFSHSECQFSYRDSVFKNKSGLVIWSLILRLKNGNFQEMEALCQKYLDARINKQPKLPSAGCVFKNMFINDIERFNPDLAKELKQKKLVKEGKVASGWIIEKLGFKGKKSGDAKVSLEHANFIVNTGKASSDDVLTLINLIKNSAKMKLGINLEEEIKYFGFF